jgi:hypothetical protein
VNVLLEERGRLTLEHAGWRQRVAARLHAARLDAQLGAGEPPESAIALAVHAERVARPAQRRLLAQSIQRVLALADRPPPVRAAPVDLCAVRRARTQLEELADRLASARPVDVRGLARVRTLLADGSGPLYGHRAPEALARALAAVRSELDTDF